MHSIFCLIFSASAPRHDCLLGTDLIIQNAQHEPASDLQMRFHVAAPKTKLGQIAVW
jgi:hypothetical protein